jgi:hypothetical protein
VPWFADGIVIKGASSMIRVPRAMLVVAKSPNPLPGERASSNSGAEISVSNGEFLGANHESHPRFAWASVLSFCMSAESLAAMFGRRIGDS